MSAPRGSSRGRLHVGPIVLIPPLLVGVYAALWFLTHPAGGPDGVGQLSDAAGHVAPEELQALEGSLDLGEGHLGVRLTPLQAVAAWQEFDAHVLADRLGLGPGEPWRLEVMYESGQQDVDILPARVTDSDGLALEAVRLKLSSERPFDPLRVLFGRPPMKLPADTEAQLLLWGRRPGKSGELELGSRRIGLRPTVVGFEELRGFVAGIDPSQGGDQAK